MTSARQFRAIHEFGVGGLQWMGDLPKTGVDALPTVVDALDRVLSIGSWPRRWFRIPMLLLFGVVGG